MRLFIKIWFADPYLTPRSTRISSESQHGLIAQILKDIIFSTRLNPAGSEEKPTAKLDTVLETAMSS